MPCRNWTGEEKSNMVMKLLAKSTLTAEGEFLKKGVEKTMRKAAFQALLMITRKKNSFRKASIISGYPRS